MPTIQELLPPLPTLPAGSPMAGLTDVMSNIANVLLMPANAVLSLIAGATEMGKRERFAGRTGMSPEQLAAEIAAQQTKSRKAGFSTTGDTIMF